MPPESHEEASQVAVRTLGPYLPVLFDGIEGGVLVVDREHRIVLVNRFILQWTKRELDEIVGRTCHRILRGTDERCSDCPSEIAFRTGCQATTQRAIIDAEGRSHYFSLSGYPIKSSTGEVVLAIEHARDESATVEEKQVLEDKLRDAAQRYRTVVDHCNDAIWILDRDGKLVWFNDRAEKLAGGSLAERIGKHLSTEAFRAEDVPRIQRVFSETLAGRDQSYEVRVKTLDGRELDVAVQTSPLSSGSEVVGTISFGRDVTRRKRAEAQLVARAEELEILNAVSNAVSSSLDLGVILERALETILRLTGLEPIGGIFLVSDGGRLELAAQRGLPEEPSARENCLEVCRFLCEEVAASGEIVTAHDRCEDENPHCSPALSRILVPLPSHGSVQGVLFLFPPEDLPPDRYDRRLLGALGAQIGVAIENARLYRATDEELERKVALLTASVAEVERQRRRQDELLALISHDLRNPLGVIAWQSDRLCHLAADDPDWLKGVGAIRRSVGRMNAMIADLVESARLESGQLALAADVLSLADLVIDLVETLPAEVRDRVRLEISPDVRAVRVDRDRMERAVTNLVTNALKYSPPDSAVKVRVTERDGSVCVLVEDRGAGIAPEDLPRIFERYFRGTAPGQTDGLGLGLYITRLIVEAHRGTVTASSIPGEGSTFCISVPVWIPPVEGA